MHAKGRRRSLVVGAPPTRGGSNPMSLPDSNAIPEDNALYRHYDATGRLLYVGITNNPGSRWKGHRDKPWWLYVDTTRIERFGSRAEVEAAEAAAIKAERPWWNITHNDSMLGYRNRCLTAMRFHEDWRDARNCSAAHLDALLDEYRSQFNEAFSTYAEAVSGDDGLVDANTTPSAVPENDTPWARAGIAAAKQLASECLSRKVRIDDAIYSVEAEKMEAAVEQAKAEVEAAERTAMNDPVVRAATRLCEHLALRLTENGMRNVHVSNAWINSARLLIEKDGVTEDDAMRMIDWCQQDTFWRCNILSMQKFRKQYQRLLMQSQRKPGDPLPRTAIPKDYMPSRATLAWARENHPHVPLRSEVKKFVTHWSDRTDKHATKPEWDRTWKSWIAECARRLEDCDDETGERLNA